MDKYICLWDTAEFSELCHKNSETKKDKIDNFDFLNFCVQTTKQKMNLTIHTVKKGERQMTS